jgi:hypothetical protein
VRVGLVGCVKTKRREAAPAQDLYVSPLFRGRRSYVEGTCDRWFILSAKHGLVSPGKVLNPYEDSLNGKSAAAKREWATSVLAQLTAVLEVGGTTFEIHAGSSYRNFGLVEELRHGGATVEIPAEHLSQGEQLAFYGHSGERTGVLRAPTLAADASASRSVPAGGSYLPLGEYLGGLDLFTEQLTFAQIERILERPLPPSSRRHRAWWANAPEGAHTHARSWLDVGWLVDSVDLGETVRFRRGRR